MACKVVSVFEDDELVWAEVAEHGRMAYIDIGKDELFFVRKYGVCPDPKLPYEEYERELCHDVSLVLQDRAKEGNALDIASLPHITEANPATRYLYDQVYESENSMHFVEHDDTPWEDIGISMEEFERQVDEDIIKFHLADVIEKHSEGCLYTCYGELASSFSIDEERKELKYDYIPDSKEWGKEKDAPEKEQEDQEKLYHLVYQRHNSKDIYEEIVPESKLLDFNGPLGFIEEKHGDNGFSIGSANDVFYDLLQQVNELIRQDPQNTFSDYADNIKEFLDSWPVSSYLENIPLSELTAVQWLDGAGNSHLIVGNDPLRIVQDVFAEIRDADKLEIREVSRQESKKIEDRLNKRKKIVGPVL